jgi:hypothetical protein
MKKILLLGVISFLFSSFIPKEEVIAKNDKAANQKLCGPSITMTNPVLPNNGGVGSFNIMSVNFNYSTGFNTTIYPNLFTGEPDQSFPANGGYCTISIQIYCDWDQMPNYIGIKDDSGQVYQCFKLDFGTHTYVFNQILLHCQHYTIFGADQPC